MVLGFSGLGIIFYCLPWLQTFFTTKVSKYTVRAFYHFISEIDQRHYSNLLSVLKLDTEKKDFLLGDAFFMIYLFCDTSRWRD